MLFGANGSGKTSVLEAVHLLGTARSFRAGSPRALIRHGESGCTVFGEIVHPPGGRSTLAVQRRIDGSVALRVDRDPVRSVSRLADELPLIVLNADSFELLVGLPGLRRRFLDWGVFHVEHDGREHWQRFQRSLAQRNHLLRRGTISSSEREVWERDLALHGEAVAAGRQRFLERLTPVFDALLSELAPELGAVDLRYRRGWDASIGYREALERGAASDAEQGFTQSGPQRADLRISVGGYSAADTLSRGQQKLLVCALKLAQGDVLAQGDRPRGVYLVDDLPSELDGERCARVCRCLTRSGAQILMTCIDRSAVNLDWFAASGPTAVFHVKHGAVTAADGSPQETGMAAD